ncbi:hypothetical protein C8A05DRAFT_35750 [Staphylotrichum tortipilum]|uniref:Rhodopsin domain-containing protein n=1 Tax=Staphylotrichum tortipilum TaxID=2831512 RepID=A0AAN6MH60_9PEZI|nr:hypothetical protein C8A05DRAFT_35750 [Staphylotrichum longicolle]
MTSVTSGYQVDNGDEAIFTQTNIAVWVLTMSAGGFLVLRLWCRHCYSKLWWDDALLVVAWIVLLVAAALMSRCISSGYTLAREKVEFYKFQNAATGLTAAAISWSKAAFAITLLRIVRNRWLKYFLWFVIVTATLNLIPATLSIWIPACNDPRKIFRPAYPKCFQHIYLKYLGGASIAYGGVIDVLLSLFPFFIIRNLLLDTREKIALTAAMSMGAITGAVVIFRAFYQLKQLNNDFQFMIFMSIFNFLEPSITIIVQAVPMFRVLVSNVKKATTAVRITSATQALKSNAQSRRAWNSKVLGGDSGDGGGRGGAFGGAFSHGRSRGGSREEPDEALLHVIHIDRTVQVSSTLASSGASSEVMEDKMFDGTLRQV